MGGRADRAHAQRRQKMRGRRACNVDIRGLPCSSTPSDYERIKKRLDLSSHLLEVSKEMDKASRKLLRSHPLLLLDSVC